MLGRFKDRFYFSDHCYFDMISNNIVDAHNGIAEKYTPISGAECTVLRRLINEYPDSVPKEQLCTEISACCDESEVRKVIDKLRKHHQQLNTWIPRARQGEYRLLIPAAPASTKSPVINPAHHKPCTLKNTGICVRPHFVRTAREDIFRQLDEAFQDNHVVFLQGIGGIGKSEIAKHWALQKKRDGIFDTVVFAQLNVDSNSSNVLSLITNDTVFVIGGEFHTRDDEETIEAYLQRKLAKIKQITDEHTLIIIDNYDIDDQKMALLFTGTYRLLVTTRNKPGGYDFPIIPVPEIQNIHHLKEIFFQNLDGAREDIQRDDPYIEKLFSLVSNHTLAIEIIAKSFVNSADTPESLYHKISDPAHHTLIQNVDGMVDRSFSDEPQAAFDCIRLLFNLSHLKNDSDYEYKSQVLVFMAAMPTRGIELSLFNKWSDSKIIRAKNSLVRKSWLRQDMIQGFSMISMHPLIREIVWHELDPTLDKCGLIMTRFNRGGSQFAHHLYHEHKSTKDQYEQIALSLLSAFPCVDLTHFDFYAKIQGIFHSCANPDIALSLAHKLKALLEQANQTTTWRYGFVNFQIGAAYSSLYGDRSKGLAYFHAAEKLMSSTAYTYEDKMWLAFLYRDMAVAEFRNRHLFKPNKPICTKSFEMWLDKGFMLALSLQQDGFSDINLETFLGTLYIWRSKLEVYRGNLERAVELIDTAESEFARLGYSNALDKVAVADTMAQVYAARGEYEKEIDCLKSAIMVYSTGFCESHRSSIERAVKLATAYQNNNQPEEAIHILTKYKKIAIDVYGKDASLSIIICSHLEKLQQL